MECRCQSIATDKYFMCYSIVYHSKRASLSTMERAVYREWGGIYVEAKRVWKLL